MNWNMKNVTAKIWNSEEISKVRFDI